MTNLCCYENTWSDHLIHHRLCRTLNFTSVWIIVPTLSCFPSVKVHTVAEDKQPKLHLMWHQMDATWVSYLSSTSIESRPTNFPLIFHAFPRVLLHVARNKLPPLFHIHESLGSDLGWEQSMLRVLVFQSLPQTVLNRSRCKPVCRTNLQLTDNRLTVFLLMSRKAVARQPMHFPAPRTHTRLTRPSRTACISSGGEASRKTLGEID